MFLERVMLSCASFFSDIRNLHRIECSFIRCKFLVQEACSIKTLDSSVYHGHQFCIVGSFMFIWFVSQSEAAILLFDMHKAANDKR